jgi:RNA recognition motif-containing protein
MAANTGTKRLFVSSLKWNTCGESLRAYFSKFGKVNHSAVVYDMDTGLSKQFGYVDMQTPELAQEVLRSQHNHTIDGKAVIVRLNRPKNIT